ncbi:M56 family metallopeptidase [Candidatus Soleaferrea massiliensis]|uniref:M56 family metallopeptidase n=1 Tax=Candidatus Soleaferrea massiliensis TaxID=1470354 RepID=UPI0006943BF4|nr:M56 family metallopeptidase [Candidatus Soleaferrea massiliensis]
MSFFLPSLFICSATMSAAGLIYLALRPHLAKRYSARTRYYAWLLILLGFLIPFRPQSDTAIIQIELPAASSASSVKSNNPSETDLAGKGQLNRTYGNAPDSPRSPSGTGKTNDANGHPRVSIPSNGHDRLALKSDVPLSFIGSSLRFPSDSGVLFPASQGPGQNNDDQSLPRGISWELLTALIWSIGFLGKLIYHLTAHLRFMHIVRRWSTDITAEPINTMLDSLAAEMEVRQTVRLKSCPLIHSPMLIGLRNPCILIPKQQIPKEILPLVLKHELVHLKRKDILIKVFVLLASSLHWFNPILYPILQAISLDCETSCDEAVLSNQPKAIRLRYGEEVLEISNKHPKLQTIFATNFYGGKRVMKERLQNILSCTGKQKGILVLVLVLVVIIAFGGIVSAVNGPSSDDSSDGTASVTDSSQPPENEPSNQSESDPSSQTASEAEIETKAPLPTPEDYEGLKELALSGDATQDQIYEFYKAAAKRRVEGTDLSGTKVTGDDIPFTEMHTVDDGYRVYYQDPTGNTYEEKMPEDGFAIVYENGIAVWCDKDGWFISLHGDSYPRRDDPQYGNAGVKDPEGYEAFFKGYLEDFPEKEWLMNITGLGDEISKLRNGEAFDDTFYNHLSSIASYNMDDGIWVKGSTIDEFAKKLSDDSSLNGKKEKNEYGDYVLKYDNGIALTCSIYGTYTDISGVTWYAYEHPDASAEEILKWRIETFWDIQKDFPDLVLGGGNIKGMLNNQFFFDGKPESRAKQKVLW